MPERTTNATQTLAYIHIWFLPQIWHKWRLDYLRLMFTVLIGITGMTKMIEICSNSHFLLYKSGFTLPNLSGHNIALMHTAFGKMREIILVSYLITIVITICRHRLIYGRIRWWNLHHKRADMCSSKWYSWKIVDSWYRLYETLVTNRGGLLLKLLSLISPLAEFSFLKVRAKFFKSHAYLPDAFAAKLCRHLPNLNVIFHSWPGFYYLYKLENPSY